MDISGVHYAVYHFTVYLKSLHTQNLLLSFVRKQDSAPLPPDAQVGLSFCCIHYIIVVETERATLVVKVR